MKQSFDEYQWMMRYKYGYYSYILLMISLVLNFILERKFSFRWGETFEVEVLLIIFAVIIYFTFMTVYKGAYFRIKEESPAILWMFLAIGGLDVYIFVSTFLKNPAFFLENGKLKMSLVQPLGGLMFLGIPVIFYMKRRMEIRDRK